MYKFVMRVVCLFMNCLNKDECFIKECVWVVIFGLRVLLYWFFVVLWIMNFDKIEVGDYLWIYLVIRG